MSGTHGRPADHHVMNASIVVLFNCCSASYQGVEGGGILLDLQTFIAFVYPTKYIFYGLNYSESY